MIAPHLTVPRNADEEDTYHPHFHVLLPVKKNYIKQADWTSLWKKALKLDYTPIVDIRRVKGKAKIDAEQIESDVREAKMEQKAVLEISKYPVKDTDVVRGNKVTEEDDEVANGAFEVMAYWHPAIKNYIIK
ncbi:hypothetical protein B4144_3959 [Bacillus atrophaeus]|nr:hypothetical protein B4144_3959 [Bacillus atrophaeus]